MATKTLEAIDLRSRTEWRKWLQAHHESSPGIWLICHKRPSGVSCISYEDAVEEALCFGWIDSIVRRVDENRFARKFTPRRAGSRWSTINRRRYASLQTRGLLAPAGVARAPTSRSGDAPRADASRTPPYIAAALKRNPRAWQYFNELAPSYRRMYIAWIHCARRDETRKKRLAEAIGMLAAGKKLGLK